MEVTVVEGLTTGEADGLDVTSRVRITLLTLLLELSAMYIIPEDASMAMLSGRESIARDASPPSPLYPLLPVPATVVMIPVLFAIIRMTSVSQM